MTHSANILSFDEVRAKGSSSRVSSRRSSNAQFAANQRSASRSSRGVSTVPSTRENHSHRAQTTPTRRSVKTNTSASSRPSADALRASRSSVEVSASQRTHVESVEEGENSSKTQSSAAFARELRKRFRSKLADRKYDKTIGARERATQAADAKSKESRAAMYSMSGSSQKRAARMRSDENSAKVSQFSLPGIFSAVLSSQRGMRVVASVFVFVFVCFMLLPPVSDYYKEVRGYQQLEAEYAALEAYNTQMQAQLDYLSTDEGLEDYARTELGYIRSGEHSVSVEGVESTPYESTDASDLQYAVVEGSVKAPDTWYSGILDPLLGYSN